MRFLSSALCLCALISPSFAAVEIASSRATYALNLAQAPEGSGIERISGRWVQEVSVSECATYTVKSTYQMTFHLTDGRQVVSERAHESREDKAGDVFSFAVQEKQDGKILDDTVGIARRADGQLIVETTKPDSAKFTYSDEILFPVEHVRSLIVKAISGLQKTDHQLFEGFEGGKLAYRVKTTIGSEMKIPEVSNGKLAVLDAKRLRRWPVKTNFIRKPLYDEQNDSERVDYTNQFTLFENGFATDFIFQFDNLRVKSDLEELVFLEKTPC